MTSSGIPSTSNVDKALRASIHNARRLYDETYDLEFRNPCATRFCLLVIAQEEAAKAFLLYLTKERVVPLTAPVRQAINNHACKHLVGLIMDYMIMHWETIEELKALVSRDFELGNRLPDDVASALEILYYEKIARWAGNHFVSDDVPAYDREARSLAEGRRDRRKQDALYVRIGSDGQVASTPGSITEAEVLNELERAKQYIDFVDALTSVEGNDRSNTHRFAKVIEAFRLLFKQ